MYRCGWWTYDLLLITDVESDGYTLSEILEKYYPIKAKLCFAFSQKEVEKEIKAHNKKHKYTKYKLQGEYLERLS